MGRVISPAALVCIAWLSAAGPGCKSAQQQFSLDGSYPPCTPVNVADLCADTSECDLTWAAALADHRYCNACSTPYAWRTYDSGGYHVLTHYEFDTGGSIFYDARTGDLVGFASFSNGARWCSVSDAVVGFVPPPDGNKASLPSWCFPDAGAPGERAFSCCRDSIDACVPGNCPSWSDVQPDGFWCRGGTNYSRVAVSACGGFNLLRYGLDLETDEITYYDMATGMPIASVDSEGVCRFGPADGITLPDCSPTFTPACAGAATDAATN